MTEKYKQNIAELFIGEIYDRDELYALSDWFAQETNVLFGSVCAGACFRAEPDDIQKDKWVVKEYWRSD